MKLRIEKIPDFPNIAKQFVPITILQNFMHFSRWMFTLLFIFNCITNFDINHILHCNDHVTYEENTSGMKVFYITQRFFFTEDILFRCIIKTNVIGIDLCWTGRVKREQHNRREFYIPFHFIS